MKVPPTSLSRVKIKNELLTGELVPRNQAHFISNSPPPPPPRAKSEFLMQTFITACIPKYAGR